MYIYVGVCLLVACKQEKPGKTGTHMFSSEPFSVITQIITKMFFLAGLDNVVAVMVSAGTGLHQIKWKM